MLGPSNPVQKNFSEEDSSGSDAGSEVGLETDRFGFLLTNGSTAGSVGPPPELVRQREAKWINIIGQWERILSKKTSKVKVQCQKGIPASLRAKCWPLLCGATDRMKQNENLYQFLDSQPALQNWVDVIERDLDRQFPFHEMFLSKDGHGQRGLFRVLKAYTQYQPEEGYCQAQGPVAAVLLMNMPAEEAFWCLVQISEQYLPGYYSPLLEGVLFDAAMLNWVLKRTCPAVHKHLQHHGVEPLMFATDWLMCLFTRHLPFNTLLRVWDLFFCYGVRVLLQVAVVLVRRVLGRADQRKQCQGQMETLERLRAVREQVQEEDDAFIAEVCSVTLSARDLERQTEKTLQQWRKDRPSSTFDPRGRCQGYRMAWERARHSEEERDRKEREKGNLSAPLARSASTLSLSPSLLHKKWRKGGKGNEWAGGGKVVRHLSMGAKEDWGSWTDLNFKKVQGVQEEEDVGSEEHEKQSEPELTGQTEQKELFEVPKKMEESQNIPTQHVEETEKEPVKPQDEQMEKEESQQRTLLSEQTVTSAEEDTTVETETTQSPAEAQFVENVPQPAEQTSEHVEELDSNIQSQVPHQETEGKDTKEETEEQVTESEHTAAVEENQTEVQKDADRDKEVEVQVELRTEVDVKPEERTETENVQQTQVDAVAEVKVEAELQTKPETTVFSEEDGDVEVHTVINPDQTLETETQQQDTETDKSSQGGAFEVKYHRSESLTEIDMKEEPHTQTETEIDVVAQPQEKEDTQDQFEADIETNSEQHDTLPPSETNTEKETITPPPPECIHDEEDTDVAADTETEAEIPVADETVTLTSEAVAQSSEKESDTTGSEPAQDKEEIILTVPSEAQVDNDTSICDQTQVEEMPTETNVETSDSTAPAEEEETSTQPGLNLTAEPDGKESLVQISAVGQPAPEQPKSQVTMGPVEEEKSTDLQEETAGEDCVFISSPPTDDPHTDSNPQVQNKDDSHLAKDQTEPSDSGATQVSGRTSSHSSGDFRIRKSSSSRGSRLARRLSEDLFTSPQKTNQSIPSQPDQVKNTDSPNPTSSAPDVSSEVTSLPSTEVTEATAAQQEAGQPDPPKRFGLFRRLRGEQPKKTKEKGTPKMQVPKILIQDFSDQTGTGKPVEEEEEKLTSRERRRRRREQERREKEEERLRKKREKELEKEREKERKKPQTRGKSFQVQKEKGGTDAPQPANTGSQTLRHSASYAESYF
ncbi:ecotropic viral integration site 5 ortholog [Thunnus albacares]|uniref:ecotropic viral integration site 5 ortholog n=1 Tax=Thunnus albacares TaxID=8236 RepID=UPI001CF6FC10|nr:ecotropic viral integration site 5 ortholog [Thunnus albacares]